MSYQNRHHQYPNYNHNGSSAANHSNYDYDESVDYGYAPTHAGTSVAGGAGGYGVRRGTGGATSPSYANEVSREDEDYYNTTADPDSAYETHNVARSAAPLASNDFNEKSHDDNHAAETTQRSGPFAFGSGGAAGGSALLTNRFNNRSSRGHSKKDSIFSQDDRYVYRRRSVPVRCFRTLACIIIWAVIIILSVILLVITFAQPPNVALVSIETPTASDFSVSGTSFKANGSVNFAVSNPNSFSATIESITANLYDADLTEKISVGNGTLKNQVLQAHSNTSVVFPYTVGIDLTNGAVQLIQDISTQCGLSTSSRRSLPEDDSIIPTATDTSPLYLRATSGSISVQLDINVKIKILSVPISLPTISDTISVDCPTSALQSIISSLTGGSGSGSSSSSALGSLVSILGGA